MNTLLGKFSPQLLFSLSLLCFALLLAVYPAPVRSQDMPMDHEHMDMSHMDMNQPADPAALAKLAADKRESEFNHHLAGFFVVLAGVFILFEPQLKDRWPAVRYAWPLCFLFSGLFVLVFSDTELWPFGPKNWWIGVTGNLEVLQHKIFAVILLGLAVIEIRRARGAIRAAWTVWVFPVLATAGSVLLLFHVHGGGHMHTAGAMNAMRRIQMEHFSYAATGIGIALSNGLSNSPVRASRFFRVLWPLLMIALGVLLMLYTE
jgi:putative copper resistance protein D